MAHATTKNLDDCWVTGAPKMRFGGLSTASIGASLPSICSMLVSRMAYFGRAESTTLVHRANGRTQPPEPNCFSSLQRCAHSVPVLFPTFDATLAEIERSTDDPAIAEATVPPGAVWRFAERPPRPSLREIPKRPTRRLPETCFVQFAIGSRVSPVIDSAAILTNRFRGARSHARRRGMGENLQRTQRRSRSFHRQERERRTD